MKKTFLALLITTLFCSPGFADKTELAKMMGGLFDAYSFIDKNISKPEQKDAMLEQVKIVKKSIADSRGEIPALTGGEADKLADYKNLLDQLGKQTDSLEAAITQGETAEAKRILKKMDSIKKEGHTKYKPPQP